MTTDATAVQAANFRWYLVGVACWFAGFGMLLVLFPWLVAIELNESPDRVGIAQMSMMLPTLFFVLIGGSLADRIGPRRVIVAALAGCGIPPLLLAIGIGAGQLTYAGLIVFALVIGTVQSFVTPAREAILPRVAPGSLQRAIGAVVFVMFGIQIVGFLIAGSADIVGPVPLVLLQGAITAFGAIAFAKLKLPPWQIPPRSDTGALRGFLDSYATVLRLRQLRPVIVLNMCIGIAFMGAFTVGIPLLIREQHAGTPTEIALANVANTFGIIVCVAVQMRAPSIRRCGRALLLGLSGGACVLGLMALPLPYYGFLGLTFVWGLFGGISITMGRTLVQELAPESHRTRVMALYTLAFLGGAPIGSLGMGYSVDWFGALHAMLVPSAGMLTLCLLIAWRTDLWRLQSPLALSPSEEPAR